MTNEQDIKKQAEEKYISWLNDRDNPRFQDDTWLILHDILEKNPEDLKTLTRLAYVLSYKKGLYSFAIELAKKTLKIQPENILIELFIADTQYKWGKFREALNQYRSIYTKNPNFAYLHHLSEKIRDCTKKSLG